MKTIAFYLALILGLTLASVSAQNVDSVQANNILKHHFISINEAKTVYPNLPENLAIPFSARTLRNNPNSWLIPVKIQDRFRYLLVRAGFECEICTLKRVDTLRLKTTEEVLSMLKVLRPNFPERRGSNESFKYFFRTKDSAGIFKKAVAYDGKNYLVVNWPNKVELGVVRQKCIFYLFRNKKGVELALGSESLPDYGLAIKDGQSVFFLTMLSHKAE